jgi:hypothetical protein
MIMKTLFAALLVVSAFFSVSVSASDADFGWKELVAPGTKLIGMTNRGEEGGEIAVICNPETHKLNVTYSVNGKQYDLFAFRKFGINDLNTSDRAGKFVVGLMMATQGDVYYNVLSADKVFQVARFPIGSKAVFEKAIASLNPQQPKIDQEGSEYFLVGNDWKKLLGKLSAQCPVNKDANTPVI